MEVVAEEDRFMANVKGLTDLVHELTTTCWDAGIKQINPALINLAGAYLSSFDKVDLIETFIEHTYEVCWDQILKRNEEFFIKHSDSVFGKLPVGKGNIDAFKMLFTSVDKKGEPIIIQDDRDAVWDIFGSLVKICIKYIHRVRDCYLFENPETGKIAPRYRFDKFPKIKVLEHAKKWNIDLQIPKI
jgi:hypothetical protein